MPLSPKTLLPPFLGSPHLILSNETRGCGSRWAGLETVGISAAWSRWPWISREFLLCVFSRRWVREKISGFFGRGAGNVSFLQWNFHRVSTTEVFHFYSLSLIIFFMCKELQNSKRWKNGFFPFDNKKKKNAVFLDFSFLDFPLNPPRFQQRFPSKLLMVHQTKIYSKFTIPWFKISSYSCYRCYVKCKLSKSREAYSPSRPPSFPPWRISLTGSPAVGLRGSTRGHGSLPDKLPDKMNTPYLIPIAKN